MSDKNNYSPQEREIIRKFRLAKSYVSKGHRAYLEIILFPEGKCDVKTTHRERIEEGKA